MDNKIDNKILEDIKTLLTDVWENTDLLGNLDTELNISINKADNLEDSSEDSALKDKEEAPKVNQSSKRTDIVTEATNIVIDKIDDCISKCEDMIAALDEVGFGKNKLYETLDDVIPLLNGLTEPVSAYKDYLGVYKDLNKGRAEYKEKSSEIYNILLTLCQTLRTFKNGLLNNKNGIQVKNAREIVRSYK